MAGRDAEQKPKCDECGEIHSGIDCLQSAVPKAATLYTIYYTIIILLPLDRARLFP